MPTVLEVLIRHFKKWDVQHIFGIPGRPVVPLITEIEKQKLNFVLARHETGAGYAAAGYALERKTLGVAFATSGPGGMNLLTSAGQALAYNAPVLFLTGQASAAAVGRSYSQDSSAFGADLVKMFEQVTKYSARVERGDSFRSHLQHAIEKAFLGIKGPVHLALPLDVLLEELADDFELELPTKVRTRAANLDKVYRLVENARNPVLVVGKGVRSAEGYEELFAFATNFGLPVITTGGGKGAFPTDHPLSLGTYGLGGTAQADLFLQSGVDLMLVVGTSLSDMSLAGFKTAFYPEKVVHFDYDATFVGKSIPVPTTFVPGDIKENLQGLLDLRRADGEGLDNSSAAQTLALEEVAGGLEVEVCDMAEEAFVLENKSAPSASGLPYLSAVVAVTTIRKNLPRNTKVFADVGSHAYYAVKHFDVYEAGTFFFDDRFIAMGNGIGYAIGASIASGKAGVDASGDDGADTGAGAGVDRAAASAPVVCITGDGCMLMHGTEIATAVEQDAPVLFFVFNNGGLDMVETGMKHWQKCPGHAVYKESVNFVSFAKSLGCEGYRCVNEAEIEAAIKRALRHSGPTIIEIMVDPEEIPPTLKRDE